LIASLILCHGLVTLAIGLGAIFSQFDWEHSTQISTNVGSFVFMVVSIIILALDMIPLGMLFGAYIIMPEIVQDSSQIAWIFGLSLTALFVLNWLIARWVLAAGARALIPQ
jgi:hypothetical protein